MNPNNFNWDYSNTNNNNSIYDYQSLDEQLSNLNLTSLVARHPSSQQPWIPQSSGQRPRSYNNEADFNAFSYPTPTTNRLIQNRLSGLPAQDYYGATLRRAPSNNSDLLNRLQANEEYLAMIQYLHTLQNPNLRRRMPLGNTEFMIPSFDYSRHNNNNYNPNRNRNEGYFFEVGKKWEDVRGNVVNFVKDHKRYKEVEEMLEKATKDEINMVISEIRENLGKIVVTHNGGQFFQSLLDHPCCETQHVTEFLRAAMVTKKYFVDICLDNHGSRAMQKLIKKIDTRNVEQKSMILSMMKEVMLTLITNTNSYYFVTVLFSSLKGPAAYDLIAPLFDEIGNHLLEIAVDKFGCCALHICIEHGHRGEQRDRVLRKIVSHSLELSENDYGNYVVQYVISQPGERFSGEIITSLYGKFAYLSMNKYACYVVEKCILFGSNEHLENIINEIMGDPNFLNILLNQTGNYVVQKAITKCNEVAGESERLSSLFSRLVDGVIAKYPFLHYDRLGKHVLHHAKTEKEMHRRRHR